MLEILETTLFYILRTFSSTLEMLLAFLMMNAFFDDRFKHRHPKRIMFVAGFSVLVNADVQSQLGQLESVKQNMQDLVNPNRMYERLGVDILSLQVGSGLLCIADPDQDGQLLAKIAALRQRTTDELGYIIPNIRIMDSSALDANEYMISINTLEARLKNIEARLEEIAQDKEIKAKVDRLVCFSGIEVVTAVSIASEVGDFNRFASAFDFSKYLGLIPAEWSSGKSVTKLGITKAGNCYLRRLLTESAKSIKKSCPQAKKSKRLEDRQKGKDPLVIAYADKCRIRIKNKIKHLEDRGKNANVATTAAARELACFIWGMMTDNIA